MTWRYYSGWAQAPTAAPTVTGNATTTGGYQIGYRLRTSNGVTDVSPLSASSYTLPVTVACPVYGDGSLTDLEYEVVGFQAGTYFSLARSTTESLVASQEGAAVSAQGGFAEGVQPIDMGTFGVGTNPSFNFYAKWEGATQSSVTALVQRNDGSMAYELYDNLLVTINGTLHGEIGTGSLDVSTQGSRFLAVDYTEGNTFPVPTQNLDVHLVTVQLANYRPGSSPMDQINNYRFSFLSAPVSYRYDRPGYLPSPLWVHRGGAFWPLIVGSGVVANTIHSFGRLYVIPDSPVSNVSTGSATRMYFEHTTGSYFFSDNTYNPTNSTQTLVATFNGTIWVPEANYLPNTHVSGVLETACLMGQVLYWNTSTSRLTTSATSVIAGVALGSAASGVTMSAGQSGILFVRTTAGSIAGIGSAIGGQVGNHRLYQVSV